MTAATAKLVVALCGHHTAHVSTHTSRHHAPAYIEVVCRGVTVMVNR